MTPLEKAISLFESQADFARAINVKPMLITHWKCRGVPVKRCSKIEEVTKGRVTRYDLRPDIFGAKPKRKPKTEAA